MKNGNSTKKIVCFDLGGVLVNTCLSFEEACVKSGIGIRNSQIINSKFEQRQAIAQLYHLGIINTDSFLRETSKCLLGLYSPEEIKAIHCAVVIEENVDALGTVDYVFSQGKRLAILSNNNELHWDMITRYPSVKKILDCFGSHLLHLLKPSKEIFSVFEKLTSTRAQDIIFFDDQLENILSSKICGWESYLIDSNSSILEQVKGVLS